MLICGIKITHDSALALIDNGRLVFSVELEKIENMKRHTRFEDPAYIDKILAYWGYKRENIDVWVVDGWHNLYDIQKEKNFIKFGEEYICVNNYQNRLLNLPEGNVVFGSSTAFPHYSSYTHTYTHLCASYCTSPFAIRNEDAYVVLFDGGTKPVLYYYDSKEKDFTFCDEVLKFGGDIYADVSSRFEPYSNMRKCINGQESFNLHFVGKVMAYIALGQKCREAIDICHSIYQSLSDNNCFDNDWAQNRFFSREFERLCKGKFSDADCLASFHYYVQEVLSKNLVDAVNRQRNDCRNICLAGGNMLNIKWNSEIRRSGRFDEIYAPPFINDSGSAIGAACAEWMRISGQSQIKWSVYNGMAVIQNGSLQEWNERICSIKELASILASTGEPVVMLNSFCELGPRALGNRSILADPRNAKMKQILNRIKKRESYRPVAPMCIAEDAPDYFVPGTPDKYMLFEHTITDRGSDIPAIVHLDGTARLQTITQQDNDIIYELLTEFKKITGVPVLCNTSANFLGAGFFPDVKSAQEWGGCNYIWSEGKLFERKQKKNFPELA